MKNLKKSLKILSYTVLGIVGLLILIILGIFSYFILFNSVGTMPVGPSAEPKLTDYDELRAWEADKEDLKQAFFDEIYGPLPEESLMEVTRRELTDPVLSPLATIEEITFATESGSVPILNVLLVTPKETTGPVPLIVAQNFCGNHNSFPIEGISKPTSFYHASMCDEESWLSPVVENIMGEYLSLSPFEAILENGYAFAGFYPGEIAPDNKALAPAILNKLEAEGTLAAWAWGYNEVARALSLDDRIDSKKTAAFGHSRYGKAALMAAAFGDEIDLVIAHQSGTGGASLGKSGIGESIESITSQYPYWFSSRYKSYAQDPKTLPIDQHQLIALAAPRPILLGNGQWDKWSDPMTAFLALQGADPIYHLYATAGLLQDNLEDFNPTGNLAFHMRPGPHGTRANDWEAFLLFIRAHF